MSDTEILTLVREESRAFDEKIRRRDWREGLAAAFTFVAFGVMAALHDAWLVRGGALLVMAGSVFIWWTLRRARTQPRDGDDGEQDAPRSVADALRVELRKLDAQIGLLESVLWWYIAPLMAGGILVTLGVGSTLWYRVSTLVGFVVLGSVIYWLNQRAVRNELRPKRERLTHLLRQVEK